MDYLKHFIAAPWKALDINYVGQVYFTETIKNVKIGQIHVTLPDKSKHTYGRAPAVAADLEQKQKQKQAEISKHDPAHLQATLIVLDNNFFGRLVKSADVGFAEAYMDGEINVDDLTALLKIMIYNRDQLGNLDTRTAFIGHFLDRISHWQASNTVLRARENVAAHYDLSNEMFETFLDPTMTYSCALFRSETESLEEAQLNKINEVLRKARISPGAHILEIGTGWGALSIQAAKTYKCRVTSLTLSREQKALAEERIAEAGLSDLIDVRLCDYRDLPTPVDPATGAPKGYDAIVSVEMIEQVGHEFLPVYFANCERLLAQDGVLVIQAITMPDFRYSGYLTSCDFIQKYIFPGSCCPSLTAIMNAATEATQLVLERTDNIGPHYARTLREWHDNFTDSETSKKLAKMGFDDRFRRMWIYYFCYCEAGFATRTLGIHHLVFTRTMNWRLTEGMPL